MAPRKMIDFSVRNVHVACQVTSCSPGLLRGEFRRLLCRHFHLTAALFREGSDVLLPITAFGCMNLR